MTRQRNDYVAEKKRLEREADETRRLTPVEREELLSVLSSPAGRAFYYRVVFLLCCLEDQTFASNIKEGMTAWGHTCFGEGVRSVGRVLRDEAQEHFTDLWMQMIDEQKARCLHDRRPDDE